MPISEHAEANFDETSNAPQRCKDDLLSCLEILCQREQLAFSPSTAVSGLPLIKQRLTPSLFLRAAKKCGFDSKISEDKLENISQLVLPLVLILKNDTACVLIEARNDTYDVIFPNSQSKPKTIKHDELAKQYSGYSILTKPTRSFDKRAKQYFKSKKESWFWPTIWRFKKIYAHAIFAAFIVNLFMLASPLFIMNVYDRVVPNNAIETLWVLAIGIIIIFCLDFLLRTMRGYLLDLAGQKIDVLLASKIFQHVLGMKLSMKPSSPGAFASNISEFDTIREFFTSATLTSLVDVPFLVLFLAIIALIGGPLAFIPLLAAPLVIFTTFALKSPVKRSIENTKIGATQKHAILVESIAGIETIKSLSATGIIQRKWERSVNMAADAAQSSRFYSSLATNFTFYIQQMVIVFMVIAGVYLIKANALSMGGLIACVILSGRTLAPLSQITNLLSRFERSKIALKGLDEIMSIPLERPNNHQFLHRAKIKGAIEFDDVSFNYPGQTLSALHNISFSIAAGEKVAIIGRVGAGKSTALRLILNLYESNHGSIRIDGTDIAQIDPADLRHNISFSAQDSLLFYGTIRENIVMRDIPVDDTRILEVVKITGIDRFINRHPSGYDMQIGERGENLSGGQRQALCMARALLAKTPILMLDEPTSAIDNRSEKDFIDSLQNYLQEETLIIATHRASLLDLVDRVIILEDGKMIADGPKATVLKHAKGATSDERNEKK